MPAGRNLSRSQVKGQESFQPSPSLPGLGLCPLSALEPLAQLCWPLLQSSGEGGAGEHRIPATLGKGAASL